MQRHSPGGLCVWEKPLPAALRPDPRVRKAARGLGNDATSYTVDSVRWLRRTRRNMASKAAPSCRLVFCLLISAAVLRPGEQGPRSSRWPTWAGGSFLRSPAWPGTARQCAPDPGGSKGTAVRAQSWPWVQSPVPHVWAWTVESSLRSDGGTG